MSDPHCPPVGATPDEPRCDFRHSWEDCPHKPVGATDSPDEPRDMAGRTYAEREADWEMGQRLGENPATQPQPTDDGTACLLKIGLNCPCADCQQAREIADALPPIEGDPLYLLLKKNDQLAGAVAAVRRLHWPSPDRDPTCDCYDGLQGCPTIAALDRAGFP